MRTDPPLNNKDWYPLVCWRVLRLRDCVTVELFEYCDERSALMEMYRFKERYPDERDQFEVWRMSAEWCICRFATWDTPGRRHPQCHHHGDADKKPHEGETVEPGDGNIWTFVEGTKQ